MYRIKFERMECEVDREMNRWTVIVQTVQSEWNRSFDWIEAWIFQIKFACDITEKQCTCILFSFFFFFSLIRNQNRIENNECFIEKKKKKNSSRWRSIRVRSRSCIEYNEGWNCLIVQLTWGLGGWGCWTGWGGGSSFFLFPALSYSWSFLITRGESVSRKMPESGPRAASSVSRTRSRSPDDSWGVDVNRTVDLESPSESSPSRCRMNRLLYLDLFLGTSYSGASYLSHIPR